MLVLSQLCGSEPTSFASAFREVSVQAAAVNSGGVRWSVATDLSACEVSATSDEAGTLQLCPPPQTPIMQKTAATTETAHPVLSSRVVACLSDPGSQTFCGPGGAAIITQAVDNGKSPSLGQSVVMVGLFIQLGFLGMFLLLTLYVGLVARRKRAANPVPVQVFACMWVTMTLLVVRNVYRVVEYLEGDTAYMNVHEVCSLQSCVCLGASLLLSMHGSAADLDGLVEDPLRATAVHRSSSTR